MNYKPTIYLICVVSFLLSLGGYVCYDELKHENDLLKKDNLRLHILLTGERYKLK